MDVSSSAKRPSRWYDVCFKRRKQRMSLEFEFANSSRNQDMDSWASPSKPCQRARNTRCEGKELNSEVNRFDTRKSAKAVRDE